MPSHHANSKASQASPSTWNASDIQWMEKAYTLATSVRGKTRSNPAVGAVLVKNGKELSVGATQPSGSDHAEVVAIEQALIKLGKKNSSPQIGRSKETFKASPSNSKKNKSPEKSATYLLNSRPLEHCTLYVTLEPCCHFGKTGPCTQAIISAGISRVVISVTDPNPRVNGKGIKELQKAGIQVEWGLLAEQGEEFYQSFRFFIQNGRPEIILKIAQSLDGKINAGSELQTPITGIESQKWLHQFRTRLDAVLVGGATFRIDNPSLTSRLVKGPSPDALILSKGKPGWNDLKSIESKLFQASEFRKTIVFSPQNAKKLQPSLPPWVEARQLSVRPASKTQVTSKKSGLSSQSKMDQQQVQIAQNLLRIFTEMNYHSVMVEGGRQLWAIFLNSGLWDRLFILTAPTILSKGEAWTEPLRKGWEQSLQFHKFVTLGDDYMAEFTRRG